MEGRVYYLIFEMADGDVRVQMDLNTACDGIWCMQVLKEVTLALWQIHREMIAHQDPKPSSMRTTARFGWEAIERLRPDTGLGGVPFHRD